MKAGIWGSYREEKPLVKSLLTPNFVCYKIERWSVAMSPIWRFKGSDNNSEVRVIGANHKLKITLVCSDQH